MLDGVLKDVITVWEKTNRMNITSFNRNSFYYLNSPQTTFSNWIDKEEINIKIYREFEFFVANLEYFSSRDLAIIHLTFTGHGAKDYIPLRDTKNGNRLNYYDLLNILVSNCHENSFKIQDSIKKQK